MLKIKDDVDLKELEKFGYSNEGYNYYIKHKSSYYIQVHIYSKEILVYRFRENSNWGDYIGHLKKEEGDLRGYIQDLIQAGLVEKVIKENEIV